MTPTIVATDMGTEHQCLALIERIRWPEGACCPNPDRRDRPCPSSRISRFEVKATSRRIRRAGGEIEIVIVPARRLYQCLECGYQFSATSGTLFHNTHLPLQKWFFAIALMINGDDRVNARQMKRDLNVSYKTAWYLCHRIREAMDDPLRIFEER